VEDILQTIKNAETLRQLGCVGLTNVGAVFHYTHLDRSSDLRPFSFTFSCIEEPERLFFRTYGP